MRGLIPLRQLPRRLLVALVRGYQLLFSPWVGQSCRFTPTCSVYAIQALRKHGALVGTGLAGWRILRCNPWCHGGCDHVPDNGPWRRATAPVSAPPASGAATSTAAGTDK